MFTDDSTSAGRAVLLHDRYPTLEELSEAASLLAARHPGLCRVRTLGTSRAGRPLQLLSIGHGADNVLVVAGAHADEFSGRASIVELAHRVLARATLCSEVTWNFLLCLDPDGAHLAEGGSSSRDLPEYFARYFRPAVDEQPEWAPAIGGRLPESRILLDLIDELRPTLQFSLHNTDVGGTFVQSTFDLTGLAEPFAQSAAELGIPVDSGNFDTFWLRELGPGVFMMTSQDIDQQERAAGTLAPSPDELENTERGVQAITWFAPQRHGGETLIVEVPVWGSDLGDTRPAENVHECLAACVGRLRTRGRSLTELMDAALPYLDDTALLRAVSSPLAALRPLADEWDPRANGQHLLQPALMTQTKLVGIELWAHRLPVRAAALLRRAIDPVNERTASVGERLGLLLQDWSAQYQLRFQPTWIPVAHQADHQANTVLAAVELNKRAGTAG
ncbi:M14 family zinc carboxypeptidase [Kitasatospora sp. NPDC059827]|uniref:M14 family zinc carboxypeptidase n=1 Tax=Kitasatospora sp. NPDC059827 TaxID=3346964 RepID=UPI00365CED28